MRRVTAAAAALVLGGGLLMTASPAQAATGTITGLAGKCADVAGANSVDGTAVQLYDCNGTSAQQWTRSSDGTVRALGKCLDVNAGSVANGAKVQLWTCNGSAAQQWTYTSGRDLVNPQANKCLDVTGNNSANSTPLQLWTCTGTANQKWNVPAADDGPPPAGGAPMAAAPYLYQGWGSPPNPGDRDERGRREVVHDGVHPVQRVLQPAVGREPAADRRGRPAGDQHDPVQRRRRRGLGRRLVRQQAGAELRYGE